MKQKVIVFWFRRDLRLKDNAGLYNALKAQNRLDEAAKIKQEFDMAWKDADIIINNSVL